MEKLGDLVKKLCSFYEERSWFEFKENWYEPVALGEYISALANAAAMDGKDYAYFVWGINNNDHSIVGTDFNYNVDYKNSPLQSYLARNLFPDVFFKFDECRINNKRVVVLKISAAKTTPVSFEHKRFIRIGSSKVNLEKYPEREAELFRVLIKQIPSVTTIESEYQNLSFKKLFTYFAGKGIELKTNTFKNNLELLTKNGKYNILAQLLSDDSHIPIRVALFAGNSKADSLYSIREFGNTCLLLSLDKILEYGDVLNLIQTDEKNRIVERKDVPLFENKAFREAIINAFVHNKWIDGLAPMITVFNDRIEILSRGGIPAKQTMEGFFRGDSIPVNEKLSKLFIQLHISESTGRGIPKITSIYGKDIFDFSENSILVKIPFNWINKIGSNKPLKTRGINDNKEINKTQTKIMSEMRDNPNVTLSQLMIILKLGKTAVQNNVSYLRKNGYIERIGSNKTGHWKVND